MTETIKKKYKVAIISPVPLYYHTPLYCLLSNNNNINLIVYYCSDETLRGVDVERMYCAKGHITSKSDLLDGYNCKFLKNYFFSPSVLNWPFGLINFGIWNEIKRENFDAVIIHAWTNFTWWLAFFACLKFHTPIFFMTDTNIAAKSSKSKFKKHLKKIILDKFLFKRASGFLTSGTANEEFYKYHGVSPEKMVKFHYSFGYERFLQKAKKLKPQRKEIRARFDIRDSDFVILFVGRLSEEKFLLTLLEAYGKINKTNKKLFLVGDGPMRQQIEQKIKELKAENVYLVGFRPRESIFDFYAMADILVLPSKNETWGIVINEAMCFGLPIVSSDKVGAAVDLVKDDYNGFIFPSGNAKQLSMRIEKLINMMPEERIIFSGRSFEIINNWVNNIDPVAQILKIIELSKVKNDKFSKK